MDMCCLVEKVVALNKQDMFMYCMFCEFVGSRPFKLTPYIQDDSLALKVFLPRAMLVDRVQNFDKDLATIAAITLCIFVLM